LVRTLRNESGAQGDYGVPKNRNEQEPENPALDSVYKREVYAEGAHYLGKGCRGEIVQKEGITDRE